MSFLKRLSGHRPGRFRGDPPAPDRPFYAIGDVHGRRDLLVPLLDRLMPRPDPIVLVGDFVDRGDDSAGVIDMLHRLGSTGRVICLRGNHEEMMLKFIDNPQRNGRIWLRYGGLQTLASYGIGGLTEQAGPDQLVQARDALCDTLGSKAQWLRGLPYLWQSGNVAVVHAGADPNLPLDAQPERALAWGHPDFDSIARPDGNWVIYGHVIVPKVQINEGRVAIDTGAYATDILSGVHVSADGIRPI